MDPKSFGASVFFGVYDSFKGFGHSFKVDKELERRDFKRLSPTHSSSPVRRRQSEPREVTPVRQVQKNEKATVMSGIIQCGLLNGAIFLCSILLFDYAFLPFMKAVILLVFGRDSASGQALWYWIDLMLRITFQSIWVVPLFAISKFINTMWFQDIGQSANKYSIGRPTAPLSLSKTVADFIFSTVVETLFLIQAVLMTYIPVYYVGQGLYLIHLSLLYSLYAFEYKWVGNGWETHKRLTCIETNWAYFFGFGLPLTLVTQVSESLVINACIFSIVFPFIIISAYEANATSEFRLYIPIFSPVIVLSNMLFSVLVKEKKPAAQHSIPQHRR